MTEHHYAIDITWTGNLGVGTQNYRAYSRNHEVAAAGLPTIAASADAAFRGDADRWNPEQFFIASIAQCHMLWYFNLASQAGVTVLEYADRPTGVMTQEANGAGQFESVTLHPVVTISADSDPAVAEEIHERVGEYCFIARSVQTPIHHVVTILRPPAA